MPMSIMALMVEDDPVDVAMFERQLGALKIYIRIQPVLSGQEALDYLHKAGKWAGWARPELVLIDWNLTGDVLAGDVLTAIRTEKELKRIVPIVITKSDEEYVSYVAKEAGAACVIHKPITFEGVMKMVECVPNLWHSLIWMPD